MDPNNIQALLAFMSQNVPYWRTLGLELKDVSSGKATFEASMRDDLLQNGILHGGVLASIVDSACAVSAISLLYPRAYATTINLQVAYMKPVVQGKFRAEGRCLKAGRTIMFCEADVWNEQNELVCKASSELMVVPNKR